MFVYCRWLLRSIPNIVVFVIPASSYRFEASAGGHYELKYNGETIVSTDTFSGDDAMHYFGDCASGTSTSTATASQQQHTGRNTNTGTP